MLDTRKVRKIIRENKAALNFLKEEEEKEKKQKKAVQTKRREKSKI